AHLALRRGDPVPALDFEGGGARSRAPGEPTLTWAPLPAGASRGCRAGRCLRGLEPRLLQRADDVLAGWLLEHAQPELGNHGEDVVEDVRLDPLVDRPARVVREDVDLERQPLGR